MELCSELGVEMRLCVPRDWFSTGRHACTHMRAHAHTHRLYGRAGNINGRQDADGLRASWLAEKLVCVCVFKCVFV